MAKQNPESSQTATEREPAPVTPPPQYRPLMPREMTIEREGNASSPVTRRFPQVRGGICEYCGVLDSNQPSHMQYKLCPHYRGKQLICSYCSREDHDEVINHSVMQIAEHPTQPGKLVVWCDSYECSRKHEQKWKYAA